MRPHGGPRPNEEVHGYRLWNYGHHRVPLQMLAAVDRMVKDDSRADCEKVSRHERLRTKSLSIYFQRAFQQKVEHQRVVMANRGKCFALLFTDVTKPLQLFE